MAVRRLLPADCAVVVDGRPVPARAGEPLAAALLAAGASPGLYCGMGACFQCEVEVAGAGRRRACLEPVRPGMAVATPSRGGS